LIISLPLVVVDKDEGAASKNRLTMPLCSAVLFLSDRGGPLLITGARPSSAAFDGWALRGEPHRRPAVAVPLRINRLALFGRGYIHGVLPFRGDKSADNLRSRLTLIFSWWALPHRPIAPHNGPCDFSLFKIEALDDERRRALADRVAQQARRNIEPIVVGSLDADDSRGGDSGGSGGSGGGGGGARHTVRFDVFPKEQLLEGFVVPPDRRIFATLDKQVLNDQSNVRPLLFLNALSLSSDKLQTSTIHSEL
jgi:hypothetical protein